MNCPQELPQAPDGKHTHLCADGCGDWFLCSRPDECDRDWICPNCEQDRLDHHMSLIANKETETDAQRSA